MSDEKEDPRMDMGRNSEHYSDPTPGTAWENMRREEKRLDAARLVVVSPLVRLPDRIPGRNRGKHLRRPGPFETGRGHTKMMNKSAIDWCDFSWNPVTGCNFGCEYCYAQRQATRFAGNIRMNMTSEQLKTEAAGLYVLEQPFKNYTGAVLPFPAGFAPTFHKYRLGDPAKKKKPANIFVCSMADLFGDWIPDEWIEAVFEACKAAPQHNYLFLTKSPGRYQILAAAGKLPELPNFWYGSSITGPDNWFWWSEYHHTFVSYEPMLKPLGIADEDAARKVDWIIAGAETGHRAGKITPEEGWLEELAAAARRAGVPLWIKDSEEIRAVIGGEPAQALPDALKRPKDRPTPHCAECEHCIKTQEGQRGTRKDCAIGWTAEGYEDGGARHIPTRGNRQSPDWCPRRKDDAE